MSVDQPSGDAVSLEDELSIEVAERAAPNAADPRELVAGCVPANILAKFEVYSYRGAIVIFKEKRPDVFREVLEALSTFEITTENIRKAGGNESEIPKIFSAFLRPRGWYETVINGDLRVNLSWKEQIGTASTGKGKFARKTAEIVRERFLDGHKIDYVKSGVAFDLEWNSKDQTFDRDLYAFNAFAQCGVIDVGILVTRSKELDRIFRSLGAALDPDGGVSRKRDGSERMISEKYGASTTWMGKLLYRLNAGRNGACPVIAIGIRPSCVSDWRGDDRA